MCESRSLRCLKKVNYGDLADLKLPRKRKTKTKEIAEDKLFPIEIVERDDLRRRYRVHYVGYSNKYDEWRDDSDIVSLHNDSERSSEASVDAEPLSQSAKAPANTCSVQGVKQQSKVCSL